MYENIHLKNRKLLN